MSDLLKIFDKHNTDKGSKKHFYHTVYEPHFEELRNRKINILEIGVFKGESTAALHEYFPKAEIYGLDIFVRAQPEDLDILSKDRVKWLKGDSTKPNISEAISNAWPKTKFDIIIDDGAHWPEANRLTFKHLWPLLKKGGKYFVEDVWPFDIMGFEDINHPWLLKDPVKYNKAAYSLFLNEINAAAGDYKLYDVRQKSGKAYIPDSTIIMVEK